MLMCTSMISWWSVILVHRYPGANGNEKTMAAAMNHTYGIQTPPDKIRRTGSGPEAVVSREKASMPTKMKRGLGVKKQRKHKTKKAKESHETTEMPEQHADKRPNQPFEAETTTSIQPCAPNAEQGTAPTASTPVAGTLAGANGPTQLAQGKHGDAPDPDDHTEETAAHKATAAKSKPAPPSTQQTVNGNVAGQATQVKKEEDQTKEEEPGTPGPLTAVRDRYAETAARENLRRPDTHQQMPSTPATPTPASPAPGTTAAAPPSAQTAQPPPPPPPPGTPAACPGNAVAVQKGVPVAAGAPADPDGGGGGPPGGPKRRREKTPQEKANHARYMRFTRHIQSS